jgi:hypothetical protein
MPAKKYDKSNVLLMRIVAMYYRMNQRSKACNFKNLISIEDFIEFGINSEKYKKLYQFWKDNGKQFKYTPSIDRIDTNKGYEKGNLQFLTVSENVSKSNEEIYDIRHRNLRKRVKLISLIDGHELIFKSETDASNYLKYSDIGTVATLIRNGRKAREYIPFYLDINDNLTVTINQINQINNLINPRSPKFVKVIVEKDNIKLEFNSISEASFYIKVSNSCVCRALKYNKKIKGFWVQKIQNPKLKEIQEKIQNLINKEKVY